MPELMLLNPSKRPSKRRRASPAQLRALAKARKARAVRSNPAPRKRRKSPMRALATGVRRRRVRRNPIGLGGGGMMGQLIGAMQGAAGALAVDAVLTYVPLPSMMTTGVMRNVTKAGLAIGIGLVGKKFLGRTAAKMAEGAMTVAAYSAAKDMLSGAGMTLGYMAPAMSYAPSMLPAPGMAEYVNSFHSSGVGEYVSNGGYGGY